MLVPVLITMTAGLVGFGAIIDRVQYGDRLADIDEELTRAALRVDDGLVRVPLPNEPRGDLDAQNGLDVPSDELGTDEDVVDATAPVQLEVDELGGLVDGGREPNPFDPDDLLRLAESDGFVTVESPRYRVLVTPRPSVGSSITALPLDDFDAATSDLRRVLLVAGLVIVLVQLSVVWLLTTAAVRPVARLSKIAGRVADGEFDTDVGAPTGSREVAALGADLDRMLERIRANIDVAHRSADDAQRARDDMERFVADVSHEFRTPLSALRGYSDLYEGGLLDDCGALDRAMERIGAESVRLHELVSDMMKLTSGTQTSPATFERVDARTVARDVADDLRSAFPGRAISDAVADFSNGTEVTLMGSATSVHQALLNVGANACQHTHADVAIEIELSADADAVFIAVVDHGAGIAVEERERVRLPFTRGDASRSRVGAGGAGLGLAVVERLVGDMNGSVEIADTDGGGATVTLLFPRAE